MDGGSAHAELRRALERRHLPRALAAARDCAEVGLADGLALSLLALDSNPPLYDVLAARWSARWIVERRADLTEAALVVAALHAITGSDPRAGGFALLAVARRGRQHDVAQTLERWLQQRASA